MRRRTGGVVGSKRLTTPFATDTFTDTTGTALASHVPDLGTSWTQHTTVTTGTAVITDANRVRPNTSSATWIGYLGVTPASADYTIEADVVQKTLLSTEGSGICGRMDTTAATYYMAGYLQSTAQWTLSKVITGTRTSLQTLSATLVNNTTYRVKLVMSGTNVTMYVGGVIVGSTDTTGSIVATGRAGLRMFSAGTVSNTVGHHYDNYTAYP